MEYFDINWKELKEQDPALFDEVLTDNSYRVVKKDIEGKNILDLGAFRGFFSLFCLTYNPKKIIAVEANPEIYQEKLLPNVEGLDKITVLNKAVWYKDDDTVKISNQEMGSTITAGMDGLEVQTISLESLVKEFPDDNDLVLKMDIEGAEYEVFLNANKDLIRRFSTIFIELHREKNIRYRDVNIIKDILKKYGFKDIQRGSLWSWDTDKEGKKFNERVVADIMKWVRRPTRILCSISTKGRYHTTLSLAIQSVVMQTVKPDRLVIFDDNDYPTDLRENPLYKCIFQLLDSKGIDWEVIFGKKKGQHHNHQMANKMGYDFVWRLDDDEIAEPDVLEKLLLNMKEGIGAVGGSVLPPNAQSGDDGALKLMDIFDKPNIQWFRGEGIVEVEHLYSSFLYRAGIVDYDLELSSVAHREETLFTYELFRKGYKLLIDRTAITWHFRNPEGGIRENKSEAMFQHDENIFQNKLEEWGYKLIVLDSGLGDHLAFSNILPDLEKKYKHLMIACCYPQVFENLNGNSKIISIADAKQSVNNLDKWNIYKWSWDHNWKDSIVKAYEKMYIK